MKTPFTDRIRTNSGGRWLACLFALAAAPMVHATDLYVSAKGSDANPGTSENQPLLTLQKADSLVKPGDTVWIMAGTYRNVSVEGTVDDTALLTCRSSGTADAPITWRAHQNDRPELVATGCWNAISLRASYLVFDGLTLTGNNDNVRQADAEANAEVDAVKLNSGVGQGKLEDGASPSMQSLNKKNAAQPAPVRPRPVGIEAPNALYNGNGISVDNRSLKTGPFPHHFTCRNLVVRKFGGAGISMIATDYYTIENCEIYDNQWYGQYGGSGISQLGGKNFDNAPGYHNVIRNNRVYRNKCLVRCTFVDRFSDGNGIILDSLGNYSGGILIANNLVYDNGGAGITIFKSKNARIDVVNNTVWRNQQTWKLYDLGALAATNIRFLNNIAVGDRWQRITGDTGIEGVTYDYNIYDGGLPVEKMGAHDLFVDPKLVVPATNRKQANFHLKPGSPALGSGLPDAAVPATDFDGQPRGDKPSRGAYQQ